MIKYIFSLAILLSNISLYSQEFDVETLIDNGPNDRRINFVYMGDGYTATQQATFITDAQSAAIAQFTYSPYEEYANFFNVYAIKVISNESGADHPNTAPDCDAAPAPVPVMVTDTYFNSTFDSWNIHRLLIPGAQEDWPFPAVTDVLVANTPYYDQGNIIINTPYYGGSGGSYAAASTHANSNLIMIHEIGHSFADLKDEYWPGNDYAAEKANMTQESDPTLVKWKNWIDEEGIGVYLHTESDEDDEWYRPHQACMMRSLSNTFCAVCKEATIEKIYSLVDPIDTKSPSNTDIAYDGADLDFSVDLILPIPNTLQTEWFLDGVSLATEVDNITLTSTEITNPTHVVSVTVIDNTDMSRTYLPASGYVFNLTWNITNTLLSYEENQVRKFLYKAYPNPASDQLNFDYTAKHIKEPFTLIISDLQGKTIQEKSFVPIYGSHKIKLDIKDLETGIYILNIKASHYSKSFKFVKE